MKFFNEGQNAGIDSWSTGWKIAVVTGAIVGSATAEWLHVAMGWYAPLLIGAGLVALVKAVFDLFGHSK